MSITATITRSKPFYVAAGATDLAVRTLREVPAKLSTLTLPSVERRDIEKAVVGLQVQAVKLPMRAQATAVGIAGEVTGRADAVYGDLLTRGRTAVGRVRRQQATQDLKHEATTTIRRTKATATTAKKAAAGTATTAKKAAARTATTAKRATADTATTAKKATARTATTAKRATKRTATTASKRAATTRSTAKGAATSARKTATSARKATTAGAKKVGR